MSSSTIDVKDRVALAHASGVPMSAEDDKRVGESVATALRALEAAVNGSLFDTEPQTFEVVMRKLADEARR